MKGWHAPAFGSMSGGWDSAGPVRATAHMLPKTGACHPSKTLIAPGRSMTPIPRRPSPSEWLLLALLSLGVSGCGGRASSDHGSTLTVGFISIGPRDDHGYSQAHAEGAAAVKRIPGVTVLEEEQVPDTADVQKTMRSMIEDDGVRVLFATSFNDFDPHVLKLARAYPDVSFIHCGGPWSEALPRNVSTFFGYIDECQYLSGVVAGHATRTKKLGFVAGKPIPQVLRNVNAFTLGARSVDPSITCSVIFTGDWYLPVKEAEAANGLIDRGVDVMTCHVNSPKVVIEAAEKRGIRTCGYHTSQEDLAPRGYLTGAEWNWGPVYTDYVTTVLAGETLPGTIRGGLKDGIVATSPYGPGAGAGARRAAEAMKARFLDGSFAIFQGPLKDNTGKEILPAGRSYAQDDPVLEEMDYLVEGVIGR
jgi:basic membrane protein A and related proteins